MSTGRPIPLRPGELRTVEQEIFLLLVAAAVSLAGASFLVLVVLAP